LVYLAVTIVIQTVAYLQSFRINLGMIVVAVCATADTRRVAVRVTVQGQPQTDFGRRIAVFVGGASIIVRAIGIRRASLARLATTFKRIAYLTRSAASRRDPKDANAFNTTVVCTIDTIIAIFVAPAFSTIWIRAILRWRSVRADASAVNALGVRGAHTAASTTIATIVQRDGYVVT